MAQTSLWYATGGGTRLQGEPPDDLGPALTLTWINSGPPGVPIEKRTIQQSLYLFVASGPLIHTPPQQGLEGWGSSVIGWFNAPDELEQTLEALGVPVSPGEITGSDEPGHGNGLLYSTLVGLVLALIVSRASRGRPPRLRLQG